MAHTASLRVPGDPCAEHYSQDLEPGDVPFLQPSSHCGCSLGLVCALTQQRPLALPSQRQASGPRGKGQPPSLEEKLLFAGLGGELPVRASSWTWKMKLGVWNVLSSRLRKWV